MIDASGHGLAAYVVANAARQAAMRSVEDSPDRMLLEIDEALRSSIGAAVSIARIRKDSIDFAGVGNVKASVNLSPLMSQPGVVGLRMRSPKVVTAPFGPDRWLLMHTDGVSTPRSLPNGSAESVARKLVDAHGSSLDDAGVLLARWRDDVR